jgi:hypothetical protein
MEMKEAATEFLANRRVAVTGVSRTPETHGSNNVYRRPAESPGAGSVSAAATEYGRRNGIRVIDGGCPLMFAPTADFGHKVMRHVFAGHVPKEV